jgi:hypothetical protein
MQTDSNNINPPVTTSPLTPDDTHPRTTPTIEANIPLIGQAALQINEQPAAVQPRQLHTTRVSPRGKFMSFLERITNRVAIGDETARQRNNYIRSIMLDPIETLGLRINQNFFHWEASEIQFSSGTPARALEGIYFSSTHPRSASEASTKQAILLCTGSHQSYENYALPMIQSLTEMGHDVMVFNYSGFGRSEGSRTEHHVYEDTVNAFDEMQRQAGTRGIPPARTKAIGYSLGGAAAAYLATERNVDIVLDRTFTKASDVANVRLKEMRIFKFLRRIAQAVYNRITKFDTLSRLPELRGRCMIVKGAQDITPTITQEVINNQPNFYRFTHLEVDVEHIHHSVGKRILEDVDFSTNGNLPEGFEIPEDRGELWYGAARPSSPNEPSAQAGHRAALDNWLRVN